MEKIERIKKDALGFPDQARKLIVHNQETLTMANNFIHDMKDMKKEVAGSYDPIISHAKGEKKKYTDPLNIAEQIARGHVTFYLEELAKKQREAEEKARKIEEARQKKENEALERARKLQDKGKEKKAEKIIENIPVSAELPEPPTPTPEGLSLKQIVDTEKINRLVAATKGQTRIPGIRIYPVWKWEIENRSLIPKSYYKSSMMTRAPKEE